MNQTYQVKASVPGKDHVPLSLLMSMRLFINGIYCTCSLTKYLSCWHATLQEANEVDEHLGFPTFKASNGWIDKWKRRYNVKKMKINGESRDVREETTDVWKEMIPELLQGYTYGTSMKLLVLESSA